MTEVIQVFKSVASIPKPEYTTDARKSLEKWPSTITSTTGYLNGTALHLPVRYKTNPDLKTANLVIIQDIRGFDLEEEERLLNRSKLPEWFKDGIEKQTLNENMQLKVVSQTFRPFLFEIFKITRQSQGVYEVFLNYVTNQTTIGIPQRTDHKIADLKPVQPTRYRINGKSDFTLSGRKQRTFIEHDYVFQYLGIADNITFDELNRIETKKSIPADVKLIDERKMLK